MKTLYLINNLSKREGELFKNVLKVHKRKTLLPLYTTLLKHKTDEEEPDAALLFQKTFKAKYTAAKNYLLRNELRLLNTELYNFIIHSETDKKLEQHTPEHAYMLLKRLVDNGQVDAFSREFKALEDLCLKTLRYDILADMYTLHVSKQVPKSNSTIDNLVFNVDMLAASNQYLLNHAALKYMRVQSAIQSVNNLYFIKIAPDKAIDIAPLPYNTTLPLVAQQYLQKRAEMFTKTGTAKIKLITDLLAFYRKNEQLKLMDWLLPMEELFLLFNIATEYYLNNKTDKAITYYDACMKLPGISSHYDNCIVVSNYILVLITQAQYKKAWQLMDKHDALMQQPLVRNRMYIARANILLLTGQYNKLLDTLPVIFEHFVDSERYYLTLLYMLSYYKLGNTDLYKRELRNMEAMFKYQAKARESAYVHILEYFKRYTTANDEKDKVTRKMLLKKLLADLNNADDFFKISKLYLWLKSETEQLLKAYK